MSIRRDTVLRRLVTARDLIADKANWIQGAEASTGEKNDWGDPEFINPGNRQARAFCAIGVVKHVTFKDSQRTGDHSHELAMTRRLVSNMPKDLIPDLSEDDLEDAASLGFLSDFLVEMNDADKGQPHRRVIGTFNRAIRELEDELGYERS